MARVRERDPLRHALRSVAVTAPCVAVLEFVVADVDSALSFLVDMMGMDLVGRGRHATNDADTAIVQAGPVAISLVSPTDSGDGVPFPLPEPRLSQVTFLVEDESDIAGLSGRLSGGGAAVIAFGSSTILVPDQPVESVLGNAPAFVFTVAPGAGGAGAPPASPADPA